MLKRILMCRPDYYGVEYEINPWMKKTNPPDLALAFNQWRALRDLYEKEGYIVRNVNQEEGFPDMVFVANAGLVYEKQFVLSNFRYRERRGEAQVFKKWFEEHGYIVKTLPEDRFFEGHGDMLFLGDKLIVGYGPFRSNELGVRSAAWAIQKEPIFLRLINEKYYHLDTCFCPVGSDLIIFYPKAFDAPSLRKIESLEAELIDVSSYDACRFVCNAFPIKRTEDGQAAWLKNIQWKLVTTSMSKKLRKRIEKKGIEILEVNLSEFIKSGGAARCLTLVI